MHIADVKGGNLGANGVVGGGIPMAVGIGIGLKMQVENKTLLAFFGDGAASTGAFHESMILAVLFQVPVVFIGENNQYAMTFAADDWTTSEKIAARCSWRALRIAQCIYGWQQSAGCESSCC